MAQIYIPPVNISDPYTYIDTLTYEDSPAWNDAVNIINSFNANHSGKTAYDRKMSAIRFLRGMAEQWRSNELAFINNEIIKLVSLYREEKDINKRDQTLKNDIKDLMNMIKNLEGE